MKIAIPTGDGFTIDERFASTTGFLVSTIETGQITKQELRKISKSNPYNPKSDPFLDLADCDTLIVREIDNDQLNMLEFRKIEIIKTEGSIISEELMHFLQIVRQKESDTCCCP